MLGGGGDLCSRERWVSRALRESADIALHALRGSTGLRSLRRSAAARSSRAPNVLRHLTKEGQARRRHLFGRHTTALDGERGVKLTSSTWVMSASGSIAIAARRASA